MFRWVRQRRRRSRFTRAWPLPGSARAGRGHDRRRDQLPRRRVVQARGDAVARPRATARATICRSARISSPRSPGLDIKISGCPNGCGQHHIAGLGFQGSLRKVGGRPAPQYFVMVGGGVGDGDDDVRAARGEDPGAPVRRGARASRRALSATNATRRRARRGVLPPRRPRRGQEARSPISSTLDAGNGQPLTTSSISPRITLPARGAGRGMRASTAMPTHATSSLSRHCRSDRPHAAAAARPLPAVSAFARRDLRQGGVPEPGRIGEGSRRRGDDRRRRAERARSRPAARSSTRRPATPGSPTR